MSLEELSDRYAEHNRVERGAGFVFAGAERMELFRRYVGGPGRKVLDLGCPLTPLENSFRMRGGEAGYSGGFIEHYIQPLLYPAGLTRSTQMVLGSLALVLNLTAYAIVISRMRRRELLGDNK